MTDRMDMPPIRALRDCFESWASGAWEDSNAVANLEEAMTHVEKLFTSDPLSLDQITLVYRDDRGDEHLQPLADITDVGVLIDPDTGDDLDLVGWRTNDQPDDQAQSDGVRDA